MGLILTLILGGLAGWIASLVLNRNDGMGIFLNIIVGVVGAWLANLVLAPLLNMKAELDNLTLGGFFMAVLGATLLLAIVNLITRRQIRG